MPRRNKPHARARARATEALEMRLAGRSDAEIAAALNYASESGARMAIDRELNRRTVAGVDTLRREHGERLLSLLRSCWPAATAGNLEAIRTARRLLDSIAKLHGLDAAQRHLVVGGISEQEFAEQARQLLEVTGIKPLVEAALPALEPAERAAWFAAEADDDDTDDGEVWSNLGVGTEPLYTPDTSPHPAASEPLRALPPAPDDDDELLAAIDDAEDDIPEETVVAELVEDGCG